MTINTSPPPTTSLAAARAWLRERLPEGVECPCCTQLAKVYSRKINAAMARQLIEAWRKYGHEQFHVGALGFRGGGGEFTKLRHWGLVETDERRGWWRVTATGRDFALGRTRLPSHANIYDAELVELSGEAIDVRHALGDQFDYDELMRTPGAALPERPAA